MLIVEWAAAVSTAQQLAVQHRQTTATERLGYAAQPKQLRKQATEHTQYY